MDKTALAVAAHPDDIEFLMAGTLLLLGHAGYRLHYMNVATGSCGSTTLGRDAIVAIRADEATQAAAILGAVWHPPLTDDMEIFYERALLAALGALIRQVNPSILLVPSPQDYMEDHCNTCRLAVTAAFCRNMRNFPTEPPHPPVEGPLAIYHALPYGLIEPLRREVRADLYVDISSVLDRKREALAAHRSQKQWLDETQGIDSYLLAMEEMSRRVGQQCGRFQVAEGWCRHSHLGFGPVDFDPLGDALVASCVKGRESPPG